MGKYANHTCFECQIKRPAFNMSRKQITYKRGKSGFSFSFNPFANTEKKRDRVLKSVRVHSGRSYTAIRKVWVCNDEKACHDVDYYKNLEIKLKNDKAKKFVQNYLDEYRKIWTFENKKFKKTELQNTVQIEINNILFDKEREKYLAFLWSKKILKKIKKSSQLLKYLKYNHFSKKFSFNFSSGKIIIDKKINSLELDGWFYNYTHAFSYLFNEDFENFNKFIKKFPLIGLLSNPEKKIIKIFDENPEIRDNFKSLNERSLLLLENLQNIIITLFIAFAETSLQKYITNPLNQKYLQDLRDLFINSKRYLKNKDELIKYGSLFFNTNEIVSFIKLFPHFKSEKKEKVKKRNAKKDNIRKSNTKIKQLKEIFSKPNSFDIINALLSEVVMLADKKQDEKEAKFIKNRFKLSSEDQKIVRSLFSTITEKKLKQIFKDIADFYDYDLEILQGLIENMFFVGSLDGLLDKDEIEVIRLVSKEFGINQNSFKKIKSNYISQ